MEATILVLLLAGLQQEEAVHQVLVRKSLMIRRNRARRNLRRRAVQNLSRRERQRVAVPRQVSREKQKAAVPRQVSREKQEVAVPRQVSQEVTGMVAVRTDQHQKARNPGRMRQMQIYPGRQRKNFVRN